jgi:hypothetical protein
MRNVLFLMLILAGGCATHSKVTRPTLTAAPAMALDAVRSTKVVETRFDVRSYRDAAASNVRHEAHAIFRETRVPLGSAVSATEPVSSYPDSQYIPLPPSAELKTEIETQKTITADLRAMQISMADTQRRMQAQYALLLNESAEIEKTRAKIQITNARNIDSANVPRAPSKAAPDSTAEIKW